MDRHTGAVIAGGLCAGMLAAAGAASLAWKRKTSRMARDVWEKAGSPAEVRLGSFPAPVERYFHYALAPGQAPVRRIRFLQRGEFAMSPGHWVPFTAIETFSVDPPAFLWDANIRLVFVRDGYIDGEGTMHAALAGVIPIVHQHGTPEMAAGALVRYLAESVWFPTALLRVRWEPIDETSARAVLTDHGVTVSMDVQFGREGEIETVSAMRHRDVNGTPVLTLWRGRFHDYQRWKGMMIPRTGEVEWVLPEGPQLYWRGVSVPAESDPP